MPPPFTSYTKPAGLVKAADHPISNENGLAHSDAPDLIRQQGVQGQVWPITLKLFFALIACCSRQPGSWDLSNVPPGPCLLPKTKGGLASLLRNTRRP